MLFEQYQTHREIQIKHLTDILSSVGLFVHFVFQFAIVFPRHSEGNVSESLSKVS